MPTELVDESPPSAPSGARRLRERLLPGTSSPTADTGDGPRPASEPKLDGASPAGAAQPPDTEAGAESTSQTPPRRWAREKFGSPEDLEKAYLSLLPELGRLRNELGDERKARAEVELLLDALLNAPGVLPQVPAVAVPELTAEQKKAVVEALRVVHGIPKGDAHGA